ncbi:MAG: glycosyltransferase, partial [Desulfobacterales bacterium]
MKNTHYPFDLYIVDNNSNDGTREWLETVRLEYPDRIKDIRYNSTNEGLPGPTNDFWSRADSELIGKVDNDTLVPPGWLERLVEAHQKIPKLAVVGGYHFRPEDFDDKSAHSRLYTHHGIKILPDVHIGGCCYLMKKSIQKIFGPMKFNPALKIHGWTEYQNMLAGAGYIVGYLYPLIQLEYMDDPRSKKCLINEKYQDYTRKIWRERGINFKSTDQIIEWLHADAQRIIKQPSSETLSFKGKNQQTNKSYYGYARPEIQALVSPKAKKILDIGCGAGVLGKELKDRQKCCVAGIEYAPEAATKAETALDRVYMGDAVKIMPEIQENSFDTIIMADFLEHIANPEKILSEVKRILIPGGRLVLSIPNVRHWSVIKDLLEGRWEYRDAGILDKTHLRFFTWQSILSLLNSAGYHIESYSGTYLQGYDVPAEFINLSKQCGIDTSSLASEGRIYQYLITCIPKSGDEFPEIMIQKQTVSQNKFTSIIILTHNQLEYTKRCIGSIFTHTKEAFELIVVDNGSTDGTVEYLESEASRRKSEDGGRRPDVRIKIIKNSENLGFAAGNNQGIAAARGDYILLMNNDVVVTPGWLSRMVACAEKSSMIGMVGPKSNYVSGPQFVENVSYDIKNLNGLERFSSEFAKIHSGKTTPFWRVVGFCMLIKRTVIEKIGGLDARYGLGNFEDDDFSLRAILAGYESRIAEDCFVHHFGNRTFLAAQIDYKKSLHMNWEIFKEKWGISKDLPYGSSYDLSFLVKDGFIHSKHHFSIGGMPDAQISKKKSIFSCSIQEQYLEIQNMIAKGKKEDAKESLERLLLAEPEYVLAHNDLGALYFQDGDKAKALKHYERAVQLQPGNVTFLKNLADFYYVEMGRVEDALQIYVKILEANPKDVETLLITGHICVALEKFQDAEVFYSRVLEIEPGHQDARQFLAKLNSMKAGNSVFKTPEAIYHEIQPLLNNGDPHRAIAALEDLLEKFPDYALAYNDLGVLYYHTGDKEKARHHYERAVEMMPENINFQKNLADFLCLELGRIEEALNIYVGILTTHPRDIETLLATGRICEALERPGDAKEFYHRVLELEPGNEDASNYLRALDKHLNSSALSPSESANTPSVLTDEVESRDLGPDQSVVENREATVSIIVSLDGIQNCVKECIRSVMAYTPEFHEILLINHGAPKGMLKWAQQLIKDNDHCHIIDCARQAGWAESLNQSVKLACGDMIVLMHNDVAVTEDWINAIKKCFMLVPNVGVVGPMSNRAEGIQQIIACDESDRLEFESAAKAFYEQYQYRRVTTRKLSDFCLAFPRELLDKIGYFDEQFVSGKFIIEDFCQRAVSGGYQNLIAADTYVYHYDRHKAQKGASAKNQANATDRKKYNEKWNGAQNPQTKALLTVQFLSRAEELSQKGQIDPAVEVLLGALGVQPEDPRVYLGLSEILLAAKRFQDAKDALTEMPSTDGNQEIRKAHMLAYAEEGLENYEA